MSNKEILHEKLLDLLALEMLARDLYAKALALPESQPLVHELDILVKTEGSHVGKVKKLLEFFED